MTTIDPVIAFDSDGNPVTRSGRKIMPGQPWPHQTEDYPR